MNLLKRYIISKSVVRYGETNIIEEPNMSLIVRDAAIAFVVLLTLIFTWPLRTVPTGHRGVITVGGAIRGIENEGFTLIAPWQSLSIFNVRAEQADVKDAVGATSDQQPVSTSMTVRYSIIPNKVAEVFEQYSKDGNLDTYIATATLEVFKAVTAKYSAPDLINKRSAVSADIRALLTAKVMLYGAQVINIDMTNFAFSKEYMDAINAKVQQDQLLQTAEKKALTVEAEQKQKVKVAEAEATALKAKADGMAYSVREAAKAEAEATRLAGEAKARAMQVQAEALIRNPVLVELTKAERWDGKLPGSTGSIYGSSPVPFMQIPAGK